MLAVRVRAPPLGPGGPVRPENEQECCGLRPAVSAIGPGVEAPGVVQPSQLPLDPAAVILHWLVDVAGAVQELDLVVAVPVSVFDTREGHVQRREDVIAM